ncbi:drug/metabolite transporter (DMT)-like permease [Kribbella sp. VKM Ac-2527]|uniref:Drug/metabolite transporter (DMT)-like permease n=1 Tax=Kribbella caucasensis TaxID=2512215 RepID=A0A4R6KQJ7_9ACTN|nr:DMT family transporter [Kribbella sp. VKM Ac-2527]TDO54659.1 drug/metabolite transporter (DMT)-like permease [Kribbella sp. VKM Ac-2527]
MPGSRRTDAVLLLVAVVWGSSYLAAKTVTGSTPVLTVLFLRYGISAIACLALLVFASRINRGELKVGGLLGLSQAAVLVLETYGVTHTSAANAGLIISLTLVITPLMDRRRMPPRFFLAAGLCVIAVGLLMSGDGLHTPGTGDLLMLAAAVVRAAHVALVGRLTTGRDLRPLQLTTVQTLVGTALFAVPAISHLPVNAGTTTWLQLIYLALFCSVFAFLAQTWAIQRTSASRASLLLGTEPVWAVAIGICLGDERLTIPALIGAVLMLTGTTWGQSIERHHRKDATTSRTKTLTTA